MTTMTLLMRPGVAQCLEDPSLVDVLNHEIRTPLAILMGYAELLEDLGLGDEAAPAVTAISAAVDRLAKVADSLSRMADQDGIETEFLRLRSHSRHLG